MALLRLTAVVCAFLIFQTADAFALNLDHIRAGVHSDRTRLVLELDQLTDFRVDVAGDPYRLLVDLPSHGFNPQATKELGTVGISAVRKERLARGQDRLSFMLRGPVRVLSAFMLPAEGGKPNRLVIDYRGVQKASFPAVSSQSLGTLGVAPAVASSGRSGGESGILGVLSFSRHRPDSSPDQSLMGASAGGADASSLSSSAAAPEREPEDNKGGGDLFSPARQEPYLIVIDAGHGGQDPGAVGVGGVKEKTITLAAARELARLLEKTGRYRPVLTRESDVYLKLPQRVALARKRGGVLFVSLHADMANGSDQTDGLSVYTLSDTASDAQTEKLAAQENKADMIAGVDLSHEMEDVANILIDLAMRENMNQSRFLAGKMVAAMKTSQVELLQHPHRYAGFAVLKAPDIPSVLVEMGFLSNPVEARRLQNEAHRRRLLQGLVKGLDTYFAHLEKNQSL